MAVVVPREEADSIESETMDRLKHKDFMRKQVPPDIVTWAEKNFYLADTGKPIVLEEFQKAVLLIPFTKSDRGRFPSAWWC